MRQVGLFLLLALTAIVSPAQGANWVVDHGRSQLGFHVLWAGETFTATFKSWDAVIAFDPGELAHAHAEVTIDLASETSDAPDNDDGLKGPQGFGVSTFPTATFRCARFVATSDNNYTASGTLSLHGVSRALILPFHLTITAGQARMTAQAVVPRTDFGLGGGDWAADIGQKVVITVDLTATKTN